MERQVIKIGRWIVDCLFADDKYDVDGVLACVWDAGAKYSVLKKAKEIMTSGQMNTGFTYNNPENHRAVVVVGPSDSGEEFIDTLVHEVHHLAVAIANGLGVDLEGETPAYIAGDSARELARIICRHGCDNCK